MKIILEDIIIGQINGEWIAVRFTEENGEINACYGDDKMYVCPAENWEMVRPILDKFMGYAFNFKMSMS